MEKCILCGKEIEDNASGTKSYLDILYQEKKVCSGCKKINNGKVRSKKLNKLQK